MTLTLSLSTTILALLLLGLCAYWDLRYRKIPNWATLPAIVLGLGMNSFHGWEGLKSSGIGFLIGFGALLVLFVLGWMGGGDIKLMAAVGALTGYPFILSVLFYSLLAGVVIGIGMLIWNRKALHSLTNLFYVIGSRVSKKIPHQEIVREQTQKIPFGLAIVLGAIWAIVMGSAWNPLQLIGL